MRFVPCRDPARDHAADSPDDADGEGCDRPDRTVQIEPEGVVQRPRAGTDPRQREDRGAQDDIEFVALVRVPDAVSGVHGDDRGRHHPDQGRGGEGREEAERNQRSAQELGRAGRPRVEPPGCSPMLSNIPAVPSGLRRRRLRRASGRHGRRRASHHQTKNKQCEVHVESPRDRGRVSLHDSCLRKQFLNTVAPCSVPERIDRMRQLTSLDAQFLALESARQTGHVAGLAILDPSSRPSGELDLGDIAG